MARFPYGGFGGEEHGADEPWTRLASIAEHLEDGEALPPFLAQWLARAIRGAGHDERALLVNLGLRRPRGRSAKNGDAWFEIGNRIATLMEQGLSREQAISAVQKDTADDDGAERFSRSQMQRLHDEYRKHVELNRDEAENE